MPARHSVTLASSFLRRLVILTAVLAVFSIAFVANAAPAHAASIFNITFPVSFPFTNPCNLEVVAFSGIEHDVVHFTPDGSGGFHVVIISNLQDVTGVGSFGNKYQFPFVNNAELNVRGVAEEETITLSELIVSQGSAPNFVLKEDLHITVNPDGTVTSFHDNVRSTCH